MLTTTFCFSDVTQDKHVSPPSISQKRLHQKEEIQKHVLGHFVLGLRIFTSHC